jgi:hypothetical protein
LLGVTVTAAFGANVIATLYVGRCGRDLPDWALVPRWRGARARAARDDSETRDSSETDREPHPLIFARPAGGQDTEPMLPVRDYSSGSSSSSESVVLSALSVA